ncbi:dihydroneopterin aldolase [Aeribacillus pallidus]|uniref:dihydroneopterin aldolase n=1 Tax=Aeribacillus pallidus TaxID=33936 RepID=UPI001D1C0E15|nr:dihydroneopterin aldolase [Bacillus sp. (in: firmicutes)]
MDKIFIQEMEFYGYHGVYEEENRLGQRFRVSVTLFLNLQKAGLTDELQHSVNYAEVYMLCKNIVEGKPFKLIESVAETIASSILETFPLVKEVTVTFVKPDPPIPGHYQSVGVEITRGRFDE